MRLAIVTVFAYFLTACQTLSIDADPERATKVTIATASIAVDAVGAYGKLPVCGSGVGDMCQSPKAYADAKLLAQTFSAGLHAAGEGPRPSVFMTAGLLYFQYELAKTIGQAPSPTDPESSPSEVTRKKLEALQALDVIVSTADQRVTDAASVNTSVAELLADLNSRVAALP